MKKPLSLFLCLCLCLNLFSGCGLLDKIGKAGKKGDDEGAKSKVSEEFFAQGEGNTLFQYLGEYKKTADLSGLTPRGLKPETPQTGPADDWDGDPVPFVNPLGSRELYENGADYNPEGEMRYTWLQDSEEMTRTVHGEQWNLSFAPGEGDPFPFLHDYAQKVGAEFLPTPSDDNMVFSVREKDAVHICAVTASADGIELAVVKQRVFEVNKAYTVTRDMYDAEGWYGAYRFLVDLPGAKFTRIHCGLPDGGVLLVSETESGNGSVGWTCGYEARLYADEYTDYTLYDFPQDPGLYEFQLQGLNDYELPSTFTIEFRETEYDLPGYKPGALGALVVKNTPPGKVFAVPQRHVTLSDKINGYACCYDHEHTDGAFYGAQSGGDICFTLPAGYYTLIEEREDHPYGRTHAQLIPVSAGERTTVTLPDSWKLASAVLGAGNDDRALTGSIEIGQMIDKTKTAELALTVSDPYDRDVFPTKENTKITEGGKEVKITDIRREIAPCSVALVIDSSGSMKDDMKPTLAAAKKFVESLPDSSFVKIVDFAGYVKALAGSTKAEALKALDTIKASGSTMLYDATLEGLKQVEGKTRPAVVVFTDGVDSREAPGTGKGSDGTKNAVIGRIRETGVPVYTIGFGKRLNAAEKLAEVDGAPDIACLIEFAGQSGGEYYPAKNPDALEAVFKAIGSKLGNNFVITYNRPKENNISDTPVYSFMVDCSGSMSTSPEEEDTCGFRMEKTRQLISDAIAKLPAGSITQLASYRIPGITPPDTTTKQVFTANKTELQKAVGEMQPGGGTPIIDALKAVYENIIAVPTSRRVIIFLTDSGLETEIDAEDEGQYQALLAKIKDKGVHMLWVGMGASKPEWKDAFVKAAKATDGEYVVSESNEDVMKALDTLLGKVAREVGSRATTVTVDLSYKTEQGELVTYKAQAEADFSPPEKKGTPAEPEVVKVETGKKLAADGPANNTATAPLQGVAGLPGAESQIYASAEIGQAMSNGAMEMKALRVAYYDKLLGLEASENGYRFAAFELELKNSTKEKIEYQIPSIFNHFYVGIDGGLYPASEATWLAENPVAPHGDLSVSIPAGGTAAGVLVFLIPRSDVAYSQVSLHFFDTNHGHIQMPIAGGAPDKWSELAKLPQEATGKLSDTFTMKVAAAETKLSIDQYRPGANAAFRVVEGRLESQVQALLDIAPAERVYLRCPTKSGDLLAPLSGVTDYIHFGFSKPTLLGPGSANMVRLAYEVPRDMDKYKSELYFDIADGSAVFPVTQGEAFGAPAPVAEFDTDYVKVRVNQVVALKEAFALEDGGIPAGSVLVDATFIDKPSADFEGGTLIPRDFFSLANGDYQPGDPVRGVGLGGGIEGLMEASPQSEDLIFGIGEHFAVFGGMERRALVIFDAPEGGLAGWTLQSKYSDKVRASIPEGAFASPELLACRAGLPDTAGFEQELVEAVNAAVQKYAALNGGSCNPVVRLDAQGDMKQSIDLPSLALYGLRLMAAMESEEHFLKIMRAVDCIPKRAEGDSASMAPEGVITQGFGDIASCANAAAVLLARLGFTPEAKRLALTAQGRKVLEGYYKFAPEEGLAISGLAYRNAAGERRLFVVPFMADISELGGYVYVPAQNEIEDEGPQSGTATVEVYVQYMTRPTDDAAVGGGSLWEGLTNVTGGADTDEVLAELLMLEKEFPLDTLSTGPVDIGFITVPADRGNRTVGFFGTREGEEPGTESIPSDANIIGIKTVVRGISGAAGSDPEGEDGLVNWNTAPQGTRLDEYFLTLGINLPDLPGSAANELDAAIEELKTQLKDPDAASILKWYHRMAIYRFITAQTAGEDEMAASLDLVVGRIEEPRCIVMTSRAGKDGKLHASIDLAQAFNEIHNAESAQEEAVHGFNTVSGFYMCELERDCLMEDNAVGYMELWALLPKNAEGNGEVELIACGDRGIREAAWEEMTKRGGYPQPLLDAVKETDKVILAPKQPVMYNGEERWAWLEMDPDSYRAISVFDNGQHSSFAEFTVVEAIVAGGLYFALGLFVGTVAYMNCLITASLHTDNWRAALDMAYKMASGANNWLTIGGGVGGIAALAGQSAVGGVLSGFFGSFCVGYMKGVDWAYQRQLALLEAEEKK